MAVDYISAINQNGSGLNITQIVESLVEAETKPKKDNINDKIDDKNLDITAIGKLTSELNTLQTSLNSLTDVSKFKTTSGNTGTTITVDNVGKAKEFNSDINVTSLATPQTLEFTGFALPTSSIGSGTITVDFGNWIGSDGTATDTDSLFSSGTSVTANTSLGTPTSHSTLGGVITIATSSGGDHSSTSFTVVGKDMAGTSITEIISGVGSGLTATGSTVFKSVTSITAGSSVGSGTVTVGHSASEFGKNSSKTSSIVTINNGSSSISNVASSLNAINGVTANIVNKGDGTYSLVIRSDTGRNSALRLTVNENLIDRGLSVLDTRSDNANHQSTAATDATLTVDGVTLNRSSNSITDIFDGYKIDINSTTTSAFRASSILDPDEAIKSMRSFIESFNATRSIFEELTKVSDDPELQGPLSDDSTIKSIKNQLNKIVNGKIIGFGDEEYYASRLGLQTNQDGSITLNENKFKTNFASNSVAFDAIFNSSFSSNSSFLNIEKNLTIKPKPGKYSFVFDTGNSVAKLDGIAMTSGTNKDGSTFYASTLGDASGFKITPSQTVENANIFYGESLVEKLTNYTSKILSVSGELASKKIEINDDIATFNEDLTKIDDLSITLEKRYKKQFSAMESAISSLKNTGDFLTNLMDSLNQDR